MRILTVLFAIFSLNIYGQSDLNLVMKACRIESDSLFNEFIQRWINCNVNQEKEDASNDSLNNIKHLILDFYKEQINNIRHSNDQSNSVSNQYLIFDLMKIQIEYVSSDTILEESLFKTNRINSITTIEDLRPVSYREADISLPKFFSDRTQWEIRSKYELRNINCNVGYQKALYLNEKYKDLNLAIIKRINRICNKSEKSFYANRIYYYWIYPDYGTINRIIMFSSGKAAIISYSSGSVCYIDELYCLINNNWKLVGKLDSTCISVRK